MIKAVIFDIDGVLLDSFEANLKFFQDLMIKTGYQPPSREDFPRFFHLSLYDAIRVLTKSNSEAEIKRVFDIGESREVDYEVGLLNLPEGAEEIIKILHKDYLLGIVTSRIRASVYEAPQLARLQNYFRVAIAYEDTIKHKPDPEPLLLAASKLSTKPQECVYIGDVENDIKAARAAGMSVIIYAKNKVAGADKQTNLFSDLPSIIAKS
ncbi:MAG: hypothetical protein C3F02_01700 [Parcubacteria group bacterium]|nr:MAG: hypothetical protein C3F02_01700 [Parcubacteria group bacterium]